MIKQKVQVTFSKRGALRFISHHDVMRLLDRVVRCAGMPVRRTEGFNPRPRIVVPHPLGLGIASEAETAEIELSQWVKIQEIAPLMQPFLPAEMEILSVSLLSPVRRSSALREVSYSVHLSGAILEALATKAQDFLGQSEIFYTRKMHDGRTTEINLRPFIKRLEVADTLDMVLSMSSGRTIKPGEVLEVLGDFAGVEIPEFPFIVKTAVELQPPR